MTSQERAKRERRLAFLTEFLPALEKTMELAGPFDVSPRLRTVLLFEVNSFRSEKATLEALLEKKR